MHFEADDDGVPDFVGARDGVIGELTAFARGLRAEGVAVPANAVLEAARALVEVGLGDRERVRIALRATLVSRRGDLGTFERLFPEFWRRLTTGTEPSDGLYQPGSDEPLAESALEVPAIDPADPAGAEPAATGGDREPVASRLDVDAAGSEDRPGATGETAAVYSPAGRGERVGGVGGVGARADPLERALERLTASIAGLEGRRWTRPGDDRIDTRRALRRSFGTGGTVLSVPKRERHRSAVRATLLVDVSRSVLDTIDRGFLVRFLRSAFEAWRSVRVFFFDTSVREVTAPFDAPSPAAAVSALRAAEAEWGGGTRIGHAIETVRHDHPDAIDRQTVAFVISDGLEVGEIDVLEAGMSWLSRRAGAVLWLNPLAGSAAYEPTCRGMAAALPFVDGLFAFAGPDDIEEMARQIERQGLGGAIGYEYDPRRLDGGAVGRPPAAPAG